MTKRARLIILLVCVTCFLVVAPILVLYSMGDRFDFHKMKITETGGIYVRTFPAAEQVLIDSKISEKPGIFSNSIFVQSLLPDNHTVLIKKTGYYDYFKTLPVQESEVTKLENVLLIKKNIQFQLVTNTVQSPFNTQDKFTIKNNNLYYSNSLENINIPVLQKASPILKNLTAFLYLNNNIVWLGTDGFLYQYSFAGLTAPGSSDAVSAQNNATKITVAPIKIDKKGSYKIISNSQNTFVVYNSNLLLLSAATKSLDSFYSPAKDALISPDGQNIIYYNDNTIYISSLSVTPALKGTLYKSSDKINDCVWLNNDYIIFTAGDKIMISEIDYRGNVNIVTLPQTITILPEEKINFKSPQIYFDQQSGKLYILTNKILLVSEKVTP